jgi:predicted molibdopterin-dependent oxidoreductase YjgC
MFRFQSPSDLEGQMSHLTQNFRLPRPAGVSPLSVTVDGEPTQAYPGETVATVLLAMGRRTFRHTAHGAPRGLFCGMGVCYDCLVTVDGQPEVRACMTAVQPGMVIETGGPSHA